MVKPNAISISEYDYRFWTGVNTECDEDEIFIKLAYRAYRDMCRSLTYFKGDKAKNKTQIIKENIEYICNAISKLNADFDNDKFDSWHKGICHKIKKSFDNSKILTSCDGKMTIGQAQKWLNLVLKYVYMIFKYRKSKKYDVIVKIKPCLHIPLDSYILKYITKKSDLALVTREINQNLIINNKISSLRNLKSYGNPKTAKIDNNLTTYMDVQKSLRKTILDFNTNVTPIDWEIKHWFIAVNNENNN